jgi:anti-anti-sigma factor
MLPAGDEDVVQTACEESESTLYTQPASLGVTETDMALDIETAGSVRVITLEGKVLTEIAQDLKPQFDAYAAEAPGPTLVDMSGVRYVCSYLVGVLVELNSRLSAKGFAMHFAGMDPRHRLVLKISGLEGLFQFHESRAQGIAALSSGTAATTP